MRKIENPYTGNEGYRCFGCSPDNPIGLQMAFNETDDAVVSEWMPHPDYEGYSEVLHGGIQATLMDEIASWFVQIKLRTAGVTYKMEVTYIKPVSSGAGSVRLKATLRQTKRKFAEIDVGLRDHRNELCTKALITYYTFPPEEAREKLNYPPYGNFFREK